MPGWGVSEFWLYDPCWEHNRRLRCLGLAEGRYWLLPPKCRNDSLLAVKSLHLGLELHLDGSWLRLWDPVVEDHLRTSSGAGTAGETSRRVRGGGSASFGATPRLVRERPEPAWQCWKHWFKLTASDSVSHKPKWPTSGGLGAGAASGTCCIASMNRLRI